MRILRLLPGLLLMLIVLCLGSLMMLRYHDGVRDWLLVKVLEPYGVIAMESRISSLGMSSLHLSKLRLRYEQPGLSVDGQLNDLALIRAQERGKISNLLSWEVSIGKALVAVVADSAGEEAAPKADQGFHLANLLPHSLLSKVPMASLRIKELSLNYQPQAGEPWQFGGELSVAPEAIQSTFTLGHNQQVFNGQLLLNTEQVELALGDTSANSESPYWIRALSRLDLVDGRLVAGGNLSIADLTHTEDWLALIPADLPATDDWRGSLNLAFSFGIPEATLQAWLDGDMADRTGLTANARIEHDVGFELPVLPLNNASARGSATVQIDGDSLKIQSWQLEQLGLTMMIENEETQSALEPLLGKADTLKWSGRGDFLAAVDLREKTLQINSDDARVRLQVPSSQQSNSFQTVNQLTLNRISMDLAENQVREVLARGKFTLSPPDKPSLKGLADISAKTVAGKKIKGTADLTLDDLTRFTVAYDYAPAADTVTFTLDSQKTNLATSTFNEWARKLALPFQLELGDFSMAMKGEVDVNDLQNLSTSGSVLVSEWSGNLEKNHFESLTSPFAFSGDLNHFSVTGEVSNGLFDVGIPITDIRYDIKLDSDLPDNHFQFTVTNLESKLVGGLVRIPRFAWDSQVRESQFNVVIYNWQFAEIIALLQRNDVEVSGILDGMLPIHVTEQGWEIREGRLTARSPGGVIRYKPDPSMKAYLSNQQQLKMAVDILENFEYETLHAVVNQELDGTQYINLTLKGKNPDAYGGTPVNLNLNIEHNINPLMQSLTLPGEIQENWNKLDTIQP